MNTTKKGRKRKIQGGRVETSLKLSDMPKEELHAIVEGAKFIHAQPVAKTEFRKAYEERAEFLLRRRLEREEARERERAQKC